MNTRGNFFKAERLIPFLACAGALIFSLSSKAASDEVFSNKGLTSLEAASAFAALDKKSRQCDASSRESGLLAVSRALEAADSNRRKDFICEMSSAIKRANNKTNRDRQYMLDYIKLRKEQPSKLSQREHIQMAAIMIEYRMLPKKKGKEYFFTAARHRSSGRKAIIQKTAENYVKRYGPPSDCIFYEGDLIKKEPLEGENCLLEARSKAQPIPSPLILTQAAIESSWGGSDWVKDHYNPLGLQILFTNPGTMPNYPGCRPAKEAPNRCVQDFDSLDEAVDEYFSRFNGSHKSAYKNYRAVRANLYARGQAYNACSKSAGLSTAMHFYAENKKYVTEIQNDLMKVCLIEEECGPQRDFPRRAAL